jgi:hypothetical protein
MMMYDIKSKKGVLMKITIIVGMVLIVFLLTTCETNSTISLNIEGVVTDDTNSSPISDARIILYESTGFGSSFLVNVFTNQDGQYSLNYSSKKSDNMFQSLFLEANKPGYTSEYEDVQRTEEIQIINFQLKPSH